MTGMPCHHHFDIGDIVRAVVVTKEEALEKKLSCWGYFTKEGGLLPAPLATTKITSKDYKKYLKKIEEKFQELVEEKKKLDGRMNNHSRAIVYYTKKSKKSKN